MAVVIRQVQTEEDHQAIARLRYDVYVEEMGKQPHDADHDNKTIIDDLDRFAVIMGAFDDGKAVATGRILPLTYLPADSFWREFYDTKAVPIEESKQVIYSKLIVRSDYRGTMVISQILVASYEHFRQLGTEFMYMHCAPNLVPIYEIIGCRRYKKGEIDPDVGFRLPMALVLGDVEHFQRVRSPLLASSKKFEASPVTAEWFQNAFPQYSHPASVRMMSEDEFLKTLSKHVNHESSPLFDGLAPQEILMLIRASSVVDVACGDTILRKGDVGSEMYLILDGAVEISTKPNGTRRLLHTLGYGQFFGEGSFLLDQTRNADASAIAPTKLLSISADNFEKIRSKKPDIAARILLNLSRTLCERLYVAN